MNIFTVRSVRTCFTSSANIFDAESRAPVLPRQSVRSTMKMRQGPCNEWGDLSGMSSAAAYFGNA
jgi:hypothetical protein